MSAKPKYYVPSKGTAARLAVEHLLKSGPMSEAELCAAVDFGLTPYKRAEKLQRAVSTGVLSHRSDGKLECNPSLRAWFENQGREQEEAKPIGQITPAQYRPSVFASPGISPKNIPNRHGLRPASDPVPAFSVRETVSIKTVSGGAE